MKAVRLIPAAAAIAAMMLCLALPFSLADSSSAEVDNDQGEVVFWTYTADFQFMGTDAQTILWEFGFDDENGNPVTSTEWNPSGIVFPGKGTYTVTQTVSNTVGSYVSQLRIVIMGTPEVTFDSNGGSEVPMQVVKVGNKVVQPNNPVREGFSFAGWYKEPSLLNRYSFDQPVSKHMTLYAKWSTMSGHGNGGTQPVDPSDPEPGNDETKDTDDDKTNLLDIGGLSVDSGIIELIILVLGGVLAYYGNRNEIPGLKKAGIVIAIIGGGCLLFGFDIIGFLHLGGE